MAHCTLIYPGLLGPDVPLDELPQSEWPDKSSLPNLALLLDRSELAPVSRQSLEQQILTALGFEIKAGSELPIAGIRMSGKASVDVPVWCLDPAHVQIDREMAYLAALDELALSEAEARQLIASLNEHFADELSIHYHSPQHWLVQTDLQLFTRTPSEAILQDISRMMPTGEDATPWRSLVNEIQMLLHNHPVNESRQQAGKLPVNSVWLWGGGAIKTVAPVFDTVYTDHALAFVAAAHNQVVCAELPQQLDAALFDNRSVLLVISKQLSAIQQKDVYAWFAALKQLEQTILDPLLTLLKNGKLEQLVVQSDTLSLRLTRRDLRKWWRRHKSIEASILALRGRYGH